MSSYTLNPINMQTGLLLVRKSNLQQQQVVKRFCFTPAFLFFVFPVRKTGG